MMPAQQEVLGAAKDAASLPDKPLSPRHEPKGKDIREKRNKFASDETWLRHETAWNSLKDVQPGDEVIFEHVQIADDGGLGYIAGARERAPFDKAEVLWYRTRPLSTLVVIAFIIYNTYFILNNAKNVVYGSEVKWTEFTFEKLKNIDIKTSLVDEDYLVTTWVVSKVSDGHVDLTELASKVIVMLEVIMMALLFLVVIFRLLQATFFACLCCTCCGKKRWKRWFYISNFFFDQVPSLSSFSAMRLLYYIVPQVATQQLFTILFYTPDCVVPRLVWFIISRAFCLLIGLDCFLIKYRGASTAILNRKQLELMNVLNAVILLNQVLGVVQLTWAIRDRLFRFVFGGEDGVMTKPEIVRRDVWNAKVCQKIWRSYPCYKAFSILMTWCDDDFQALVLRDPTSHASVKREAMEVKDASATV
jgi:hypothetical protein